MGLTACVSVHLLLALHACSNVGDYRMLASIYRDVML